MRSVRSQSHGDTFGAIIRCEVSVVPGHLEVALPLWCMNVLKVHQVSRMDMIIFSADACQHYSSIHDVLSGCS